MYLKIYPNGQFGPYPGVTIASPTAVSDAKSWEGFMRLIKNIPELTTLYSVLSVNSLHMTWLPLYNRLHDALHNWCDFIDGKLADLDALKEVLNRIADGDFTLELQFDAVRIVGSTIQLVLKPNAEQERLIRDILSKLGKDNVDLRCHITLAYAYRIPTNATGTLLCEEVSRIFSNFFANNKVKLTKPQLYYYFGMNDFYPFQTGVNPFIGVDDGVKKSASDHGASGVSLSQFFACLWPIFSKSGKSLLAGENNIRTRPN